jgi:UDP-glucose:(heptosyl)LPS alpha-1,3-glucosyltransferase
MNIAFVRQKYTPYGGAERFVERAMAALRNQGTDVSIIARKWRNAPGGPPIIPCRPFHLGRTWRDRSFARCVQHIIAEGRFDLVQSHERIPGCHIYRAGDGVHATWLELRDRARGGLSRLGSLLSPWHRYTLAAEAATYRHPNLKAVICNSIMVRDDIALRFGLPEDRLHVIYNGVDLEFFHPGLRDIHRTRVRAELGIAEETPVILFVGSGFERKGIPVLLRALAQMQREDAVLLVVGRDSRKQKMKGLAANLGVAHRVVFLGGQKDVRSHLGAADMFCLPTLYDPMPNAAMEALACGLPVITSTTCGAAELIEPGVNGYVCDARDEYSLAHYLDTVSAGARHYPAAARAAAEKLSLDAMAARLGELYRQLAPV